MNNAGIEIRDLRDGRFLWMDKATLEVVSKIVGNTGVAVYAWLCYYANSKKQDCFPSVTTLAGRCNLSRRTIMRLIKELENAGAIQIERKHGKSNIYRLLDVEKTGDISVTSDIGDAGGVTPMSPSVVTPQIPEQELIKQELLNKTEAVASVFSKAVDNLPYPPPKEDDLNQLKELCVELMPDINLPKFIKKYVNGKGYPPPAEVMIKLCIQFKEHRSSIDNPWGWFKTTVKSASALYFADLNVKEHQKYKEKRTECVMSL